MSKAIRKASNVVVTGARLYRELVLSALTIGRERPPTRHFDGV